MSEYQLLYLRFLQLKRDWPHLRHDGHGPTATGLSLGEQAIFGHAADEVVPEHAFDPVLQRQRAEREFGRQA